MWDPLYEKILFASLPYTYVIKNNNNSIGYLYVILENKLTRFVFDENLGIQCLIQIYIRLFLLPIYVVICIINESFYAYRRENKTFAYTFFLCQIFCLFKLSNSMSRLFVHECRTVNVERWKHQRSLNIS